jgi:heterodisulfide reductase subunit C
MDHTPRRLFALVKAGFRDEVLNSNTFWYCTSCYTCTVRCPRQIKITDVMYALKRLALKKKHVRRKSPARAFYSSFVDIIERDGRSFEPEMMIRFMLRTDPRLFLKNAGLGLKLMKHGRLSIRRNRIRGRKELRAIIQRAKSESA